MREEEPRNWANRVFLAPPCYQSLSCAWTSCNPLRKWKRKPQGTKSSSATSSLKIHYLPIEAVSMRTEKFLLRPTRSFHEKESEKERRKESEEAKKKKIKEWVNVCEREEEREKEWEKKISSYISPTALANLIREPARKTPMLSLWIDVLLKSQRSSSFFERPWS